MPPYPVIPSCLSSLITTLRLLFFSLQVDSYLGNTEEKCQQMIPALDPCIGPMSVASLSSLSFPFQYKLCYVTCFKTLSFILYFRRHTIISHRPSHPMYFVILHILYVFLWKCFLSLFELKFTKCVCHQDQVSDKCHEYLINLIPVALWPLH